MNVEEVVVGPFHSSTAPLQVALLVLQQLKGRYTHINPQFHKGFTHLLSFLLHFWTGAVSLFLFINTHVEQLFQRKKFESANNNTILLWAVHSRQMVEAGQKLHNKILSGYFMNAEPFFSGFWIDTNIYSPRALIS